MAVAKCSFTFKFIDVVAEVIDLKLSSVLPCVRSWFSHEGRLFCAEVRPTVVRVSQEAMSERECLLVPSPFSPWLKVCVGNSGALEEVYISK